MRRIVVIFPCILSPEVRLYRVLLHRESLMAFAVIFALGTLDWKSVQATDIVGYKVQLYYIKVKLFERRSGPSIVLNIFKESIIIQRLYF